MKLSQPTKDSKKRIKEKNEKENTEMKTKLPQLTKFLTTTLPWLVLLALLAGFVGVSFGYERGKHDQKQVNAEVVKQVASLKANQ